MKTFMILSIYTLQVLSLLSPSFTFTPTAVSFRASIFATQRHMFGGSGKALALDEDDDDDDNEGDMTNKNKNQDSLSVDQRKQMEQMAKAMGMTVDEYMLGMNARMRMEQDINNLRVEGGESSKGVLVERDGNSPPKFLKVTVTEEGKTKLGKSGVEKEVVAALKSAGERSKKGREQAQQRMMQFIAEQMKAMGKA